MFGVKSAPPLPISAGRGGGGWRISARRGGGGWWVEVFPRTRPRRRARVALGCFGLSAYRLVVFWCSVHVSGPAPLLWRATEDETR
jgi:hypothetical protein